MTTIISVENLSKKYVIGRQRRERYTALRDVIASGVRGAVNRVLRPRSGGNAPENEDFWALRDISFDIQQGDRVGIIGRNGAGKSTLLKILSRITEPTAGKVSIKGRVASLLEVGTGFHPELTGRENIFLNGAILGMSRAEIGKKFDEIVAFAEVEKFLNTPVKRYSSGMYVRLAFAVAAHLDPEILIVDEVLAVGDARFQKKCLGKMGAVSAEGRTLLFVSHNMAALTSLCEKAIWLDEGRVVAIGDPERVSSDYVKKGASVRLEQIWHDPATAPGGDTIRLHSVNISYPGKDTGANLTVCLPISLEFRVWNLGEDALLNFSVMLYDSHGGCLFNTVSKPQIYRRGMIRGAFRVPGDLMNDGTYRVRLLLVKDQGTVLADFSDVATFEVHDVRDLEWYGKWQGAVRPRFEWETSQPDREQTP